MEKRVVITFFGNYTPEEREEILENLRKKTRVEEKDDSFFPVLITKERRRKAIVLFPKGKSWR